MFFSKQKKTFNYGKDNRPWQYFTESIGNPVLGLNFVVEINKYTHNQKTFLEENLKSKYVTSSDLSSIVDISQRKLNENTGKL